jgi:hypothetical protein
LLKERDDDGSDAKISAKAHGQAMAHAMEEIARNMGQEKAAKE